MIIVYWFYYVYDKINHPPPPSVLSPKTETHSPLSSDFQISISFMSEKCQNLLPLKSIALRSIQEKKRNEIEADFVFTAAPRPLHSTRAQHEKSDPKKFSSRNIMSQYFCVVTQFRSTVSSSPFFFHR